MAAKPVGVGLIGCGTVGSGVVKLLVEHGGHYRDDLGVDLQLRGVLCRAEDVGEQTAQVPDGMLVHDVEAFFATPEMDIIVELAGGTTFARDVVDRALAAGKHVVTANKALLAKFGPKLFGLARKNSVTIGFEASCGGGIPCITALCFGLMSNRIEGLYGILNGTCNYILTEMTQKGEDYATALDEAQEAGYAEADPTLDVSGGDTAHKVAILASLAFGVQATDDQVPCTGVDTLDLADIQFGAEMGYDIKLLGIAERQGDGVSVSVAPCFIHKEEQLAQVHGSFNALSVYGHAVGHTLYYGRGAGQMPTASAVVSDVINIANGWYARAYDQLSVWPDQQAPARFADAADMNGRFYLRFNAMDTPGVVAQITRVLGDVDISISAVSQHEINQGEFVPLVILTHDARQGAVNQAIGEIEKLDCIAGRPVVIRIVEFPEG